MLQCNFSSVALNEIDQLFCYCLLVLGLSEDAEWIDEDEVDLTGLDIPASSQRSTGLPVVADHDQQLPWD
jgi:hypothetical protein